MPAIDHFRKGPVWHRPLRGIQIFGDYAKWHPHIDALMADGLFSESGCFNMSCRRWIFALWQNYSASRYWKKLKDEGRFEDTLINKIITLQHNSGFSFHKEVHIHAGDE